MISNLHAETAAAVGEQNQTYALLMNILPFVLIFAVFYFLLIRPQRKKQQAQQAMINAIKTGEHVLLNSGFKGKVRHVKDNGYFVVEIATGVEVEVLKSAIISVIKD